MLRRAVTVLVLVAMLPTAAAMAQPPASPNPPAPQPQAPAPTAPPQPAPSQPAPAPYPYPPYPGYPPPQPYPPYPQYPQYPQPYPPYLLPPPPMHTVHRYRKGMLISGSITFGASWGLAALVALSVTDTGSCSDCQRVRNLIWIPIVGPGLVAITEKGSDSGVNLLFGMWSAAELTGALLMTFGFLGEDVREPIQMGPVSLVPMVTSQTRGLGLRMIF